MDDALHAQHASWLNQIECAFSILQAKVLARGSFRSPEELRDAVHDFLVWFNADRGEAERRLAGHVETGRESVSDPALGR